MKSAKDTVQHIQGNVSLLDTSFHLFHVLHRVGQLQMVMADFEALDYSISVLSESPLPGCVTLPSYVPTIEGIWSDLQKHGEF